MKGRMAVAAGLSLLAASLALGQACPTVAVVIPETVIIREIPRAVPDPAAETAIIKNFVDYGLNRDASPECATVSYSFRSQNYSHQQIRFVFDSVDGRNNRFRGWAVDNLVVGPAVPGASALETADLGLGWDVPEEVEPATITVVTIPNPIRDVHTTRFTVLGAKVKAIRVEVCDLTGRLAWGGEAEGNELPWHKEDVTGLPVANGVYLYIAYVRVGGTWVRTDLQKLVIRR